METYLVINTKTSEIYQRNGAVAEFATYHQARQIRITMNDQGKVVRDIEGTTSTYVDRPVDWQVIATGTITIERKTQRSDKRHRSGIYTRGQEIVYKAKGELNPIKRAPNARSGRRKETPNIEMIKREVAGLAATCARLKQRIETIEQRMEGMELGESKIKMMERKIKYKGELIQRTKELRAKQAQYLTAQSKARSSQNKTGQSTKSRTTATRRKSS